MSLQPLFRRFEETIKLARFDENKELREKRDRILARMREKKMPATFEWFNQGSYQMGTGVKPLDGDYDIDIGVVFPIDRNKYDPVTVKGWVYDAVKDHTTNVEWRRPCITVHYSEKSETIYHVDLAILAKDPAPYTTTQLAVGKQHSSADQRAWQQDDRKGFMQALETRFTGEDMAQFRRVIRCLKRWKDVHFSKQGHAAPTGLALTVAAYQWFQPAKEASWAYDAPHDDLKSLRSLVGALRNSFTTVWDAAAQKSLRRITLQFPFAPWDDVFAKMSNQQAQELYQRLETLSGWLDEAQKGSTALPLRKAFGDQFPEK